MGTKRGLETLHQVLEWLAGAPEGTALSAAAVHRLLLAVVDVNPVPAVLAVDLTPTWRERLWSVPGDTRMTLPEAAEALGKSKSWAYKRTGPKSRERLPCRRLDGELVFVAGELRRWIQDHEEIIEPGRPERPVLRAG